MFEEAKVSVFKVAPSPLLHFVLTCRWALQLAELCSRARWRSPFVLRKVAFLDDLGSLGISIHKYVVAAIIVPATTRPQIVSAQISEARESFMVSGSGRPGADRLYICDV